MVSADLLNYGQFFLNHPYLVLLLIAVGTLSGCLSGLLGIGGGSIVVPALMFILPIDALEGSHVAVATSTASIFFTSFVSAFNHRRHQHLHHHASWMMLGGLIGAFIAAKYIFGHVQAKILYAMFVFFLFVNAIYLIHKTKKSTIHFSKQRTPKFASIHMLSGFLIACLASLIGLGGGFLTMPLLLFWGMNMHVAIATSTNLGLMIAFGSTVAYIQGIISIPNTIGFIYWPALLLLCPISMLFAYLSSQYAKKLNKYTLQRYYAYFLVLMCLFLIAVAILKLVK